MNRIMMAAAGLLCLAAQAHAQSGNLDEADKSYLIKERRGAAYELESAKLAVSRATRPDVKSYAEKLVHDHEMYNSALEQLGKQEGMTLPTDPDAEDKAHMAELEKLTGPAFDAQYVKDALRINANDKSDTAKEKAQTHSEAIKAFIERFAGMDAEHEKLAKQLEQ